MSKLGSIKESLNVEFFGFKMVAKMLIWSFHIDFNENQNAFHDRGRKFQKCHIRSLEMLKFLSHQKLYNGKPKKKNNKHIY